MAPRGHGLALVQMTLRRWELDWVPRGESVVALARTVLGRGCGGGQPPRKRRAFRFWSSGRGLLPPSLRS